MKELNLPITQRFATRPVDTHEALKDLASGKIDTISLGTIDFGTSGKALNQARANGGMVIWEPEGTLASYVSCSSISPFLLISPRRQTLPAFWLLPRLASA